MRKKKRCRRGRRKDIDKEEGKKSNKDDYLGKKETMQTRKKNKWQTKKMQIKMMI